jgi:hypothetical protein
MDFKELGSYVASGIKLKGIYHVVHRDIWGKVKDEEYFKNDVMNEGYNSILDIMFHGSTQITTWYFAPFINDQTIAVTLTYASPGYTEATDTHYSETNRQAWPEDAASSQSITNSTAVTITAAGSYTFYGFGIVGGGTAATTKADTTHNGTLFSAGKFSAAKSLTSGETLSLTYTLSKA